MKIQKASQFAICILVIAFCLITVIFVNPSQILHASSRGNTLISTSENEKIIHVGIFGEGTGTSEWFDFESLTTEKVTSENLSKYDALAVTGEYLKKADLKKLRELLRGAKKTPLLFLNCQNISAPAFMNSDIENWTALEMQDKEEVQLLFYYNQTHYVTFGEAAFNNKIQEKLAKCILDLETVNS